MSKTICFRIREKDKEILEFLNSLDESVDISDAIRTCVLTGIRTIGNYFPKKLEQNNASKIIETIPVKEEESITVEEDEELETMGDKLIQSLVNLKVN